MHPDIARWRKPEKARRRPLLSIICAGLDQFHHLFSPEVFCFRQQSEKVLRSLLFTRFTHYFTEIARTGSVRKSGGTFERRTFRSESSSGARRRGNRCAVVRAFTTRSPLD